MSDKNYSVDDILYEYSKKTETKRKPKPDFDLEKYVVSSHSNTEKQSKKFEVNIEDDYSASYNIDSSDLNISDDNDKVNDSEYNIDDKANDIYEQINLESSKKHGIHKKKHFIKEKKHDEPDAESFGSKTEEPNNSESIKPLRKSSGNTEIIEGLLKMKRERVSTRTSELTPINRKNIKDIHLDITSKIIPKTEQMSVTQIISEDDKMKLLEEKRKKKIRDFVLLSEENENEDEEAEIEDEQVLDLKDYEKVEDAPTIAKEISQLKSTLIVRFCILLITGLLTSFIVIANENNWSIINILSLKNNPESFIFINCVLGILAAFVSYSVISNGFRNFFQLNADPDSLCAFALVSSLLSTMAALFDYSLLHQRHIRMYLPIAIIALMFNTLGKIFIVNRTQRNFEFITSDNEKYGLFQINDENTAAKFTKGALNDFPSLSSMKKTEFVNNFIDTSYSADLSDTYSKFAVPIIVFLGLLSSLISIIFNSSGTASNIVLTALATFAGTIAICSSFGLMLVVTIPFSKASKRYLESSACIIGYPAVEEFYDTNSILLGVEQLFPEGTVDLVNLKQLSSTSLEDGILIAASLSCQAGSILKSTFYKMLRGKTEMLYPVESYIYEDTLGLSGWIENKRVLLGTRELMINHSIEGLPSVLKERQYCKKNCQVLYLSVSGEITTMFVMQIKASHGVKKWLKVFEKEDIIISLRSIDALISLNFLSEIFDVSPECFKLIPFRFHKSFDEQTTYVPKMDSSMVCSGKFQSFAMLITGAKRLNKAAKIGISLVLFTAAIGGIIALLASLLSSFSDLTSSVILTYNMICLAITLGILTFTKS